MSAQAKAIVTAVEFEVEDTLVVADPCYIDTDDGATEHEVTESALRSDLSCVIYGAGGTWRAEIEESDEGDWGTRVKALVLTRRGTYGTGATKRVGENGVDSGQMYAGCASNLPLNYDALLGAYEGDHSRRMLAFGGGAVSSTGYGDGLYPVDVEADAHGRPARVTVTFIGPEAGDEYDEFEAEDEE